MRTLLSVAALAAAALTAAGVAGARSVSCSAKGMSAALPKQALPAKVAATRARIVRAAVKCDYATLERIAKENPQGFEFTFGIAKSPAAYWRGLETTHQDKPMRRLVGILKTPVVRNEVKDYAWPSAYTEKPTAADWRALVRSGAYTNAEVARLRKAGAYLGYRTAISPSGRWRFFVAGD